MNRAVLIAAILADLSSPVLAQETGMTQPPEQTAQPARPHSPLLTVDAQVGDILESPAFAGFATRVLPWHDRAYDPALPLAQIGSLLPYHSAVDPGTVVSALNRMIGDANSGQTIFYEIYSEAERQADPAKAAVGLFFLRGRSGAPFALIAPGGGFAYVGAVHEGFPYAERISELGLNAFVLTYRTGQGGRIATEDMARAIGWIFANAPALGISTKGYSLWGSSAGARMAAFIGSHGPAAFGAADLPGPAAVIIAYTSHADLAATEPATFVVVGDDDAISPPANMERRIAALRRLGTPVEYHRFPAVGHGFGTGAGTSAEGWIADAVRFWNAHR